LPEVERDEFGIRKNGRPASQGFEAGRIPKGARGLVSGGHSVRREAEQCRRRQERHCHRQSPFRHCAWRHTDRPV